VIAPRQDAAAYAGSCFSSKGFVGVCQRARVMPGRGCGVTDQWGAKAMPPLWQYFSRLLRGKAGESIAAPKGHGPRLPAAFPLQIGTFLGNHAGATMAIVDPSGWHPQLARGGGRGHAPVVAVLLLQAGLTAGAGSVGWPGTRQAERSQTWPVRSARSRLPRPSRRRRRRPSDRRRLRAASSQRSRRHRPRCPFAAGGSRCSSRSAWLSLFGGAATGTGERCRARRPRDTP
jgi:hypothetical protein